MTNTIYKKSKGNFVDKTRRAEDEVSSQHECPTMSSNEHAEQEEISNRNDSGESSACREVRAIKEDADMNLVDNLQACVGKEPRMTKREWGQ